MGRKLRNTVLGLGVIATSVHLVNQFIFKFAVRKEILDYNNGKYFKTNDGKMFYKEYGSVGSPVLLVHDINYYSSGYEWSNIVGELSKNHRVYVVDLIGCGRSTKLNLPYTSYFYVQCLSKFIEDVIGEQVDIIASGDAVPVVLKMYDFINNKISKIVAISPQYIKEAEFLQNDKITSIKNKIMVSPILGTLIYNFAASKNIIEEKFEEEFYYDKKKISNRIINAYYESSHLSGSNSKFIFCSLFNNYLYCNPFSSLENIDSDCLKIIFGDKDEIAKDVLNQYSDYCEDLNFNYIKDTKKMPHLENAKEVLNVIDEFFD